MKRPLAAEPAIAETRRRLLEASRILFAQEGYAQVSLNDVLREVGQTKGAIYYHFRDKRHLFREVVELVQGEVAANARAAHDGFEEPEARLTAWVRTFFAELRRPEVTRVLCVEAGAVLTFDECAAIDEAFLHADLRAVLALTRPGETLDPVQLDAAARMVIGAIYQVTGALSRGGKVPDDDRTVEELVLRIVLGIPARLGTLDADTVGM